MPAWLRFAGCGRGARDAGVRGARRRRGRDVWGGRRRRPSRWHAQVGRSVENGWLALGPGSICGHMLDTLPPGVSLCCHSLSGHPALRPPPPAARPSAAWAALWPAAVAGSSCCRTAGARRSSPPPCRCRWRRRRTRRCEWRQRCEEGAPTGGRHPQQSRVSEGRMQAVFGLFQAPRLSCRVSSTSASLPSPSTLPAGALAARARVAAGSAAGAGAGGARLQPHCAADRGAGAGRG